MSGKIITIGGRNMKKVTPRNLEIVLLPGDKNSAKGNDKTLGQHTVCISGFINDDFLAHSDDDLSRTREYIADIDSLLWDTDFLQASTMTSWGEIFSYDSDEVDHSGWGILSVKTGHTDIVIKGKAVRKLRLNLKLTIRGEANYWKGFGFQTIANGNLLNLAEVLSNINETEDISYER